jgi:hypothetical protein
MGKEQLKTTIRRWDHAGSLFALCVCLGLAGEYLVPWLSVHVVSRLLPGLPNLHLMAISHFLIVGGVAGELLSHRKESSAASALALIQEEESDQMKREVAAANERAAEANQKAESERLERLKLEERLAPLKLSHEQMLALHGFALRAGRHNLDIVIVGGTNPAEYAQEISFSLGRAGWRVQLWAASQGVIERGISIFVSTAANLETAHTAKELGAALNSAGISCKPLAPFAGMDDPGIFMGGPTIAPTMPAHIKMYVGEKEYQAPETSGPTLPQ